MTKAERLAAVFAIAFAIIYAPTMDFNWTLATYHPIQGIWQFGRAPPLGGGWAGAACCCGSGAIGGVYWSASGCDSASLAMR